MTNKDDRRITSEKPISLHPLKFEDAVSALLKVKPEPKAKKPKKSVQKNGQMKVGTSVITTSP